MMGGSLISIVIFSHSPRVTAFKAPTLIRAKVCSGSLNPDSPLSGKLPLEGDCLDEETTFIFPRVQTGSFPGFVSRCFEPMGI